MVEPSKSQTELRDFGSVLKAFVNIALIVALVVISLVFWIYAFLYIGSTWSPKAHSKDITIAILIEDEGFNWESLSGQINNTIIQTMQSQQCFRAGQLLADVIITTNSVSWKVLNKESSNSSCVFNQTSHRNQFVDSIVEGHFWGGLYIPQNFSQNLFAPSSNCVNTSDIIAFATGGEQTFTSIIEYIDDEGRNLATNIILTTLVTEAVTNSKLPFLNTLVTTVSPSSQPFLNPFFILSPYNLVLSPHNPVSATGENTGSFVCLVFLGMASMIIIVLFEQFLKIGAKEQKLPSSVIVWLIITKTSAVYGCTAGGNCHSNSWWQLQEWLYGVCIVALVLLCLLLRNKFDSVFVAWGTNVSVASEYTSDYSVDFWKYHQ